MLAQYYKYEKIIRIFFNCNSQRLIDIPYGEKKKWGFPSFKNWYKTTWGYELNFDFEVLPLGKEQIK